MKSPFPGMDPYLEEYWRDVHQRLCIYACDALQPQVTPALRARVEERLVVESPSGHARSIYPDVKVVERTGHAREPAGATATATLAEPLALLVEDEPAYEGFIQIIDPAEGGKLVTVIEFLSPSNKLPGEGQRLYRDKQRELRQADVSLVEIDLVRAGDWIFQVPPSPKVLEQFTPYRACIHRAWQGSRHAYYAFPMDRPLPAIPIPLRETDAEARLDLQPLIDQVYRNGAYDDIDYTKPTDPPLTGDAAAWADALLRKAGRR